METKLTETIQDWLKKCGGKRIEGAALSPFEEDEIWEVPWVGEKTIKEWEEYRRREEWKMYRMAKTTEQQQEKPKDKINMTLRDFENTKLSELAELCYNEAKNKGFHHDGEVPNLANYCMNLHGEVSELWESYRKGQIDKPCDKSEKMRELGLGELNCLEEELADIFIRTCDTAGAFHIDLVRVVFIKMMYNRSRPYRNGGKLA